MRRMRSRLGALFSVLALASVAARANAQAADWSAVDGALGRAGSAQPGNVQKYSFPRSDLSVSLAGTRLKPGLALGTWLAFKRTSDGKALAMGDLVLTEDEVPAVMSRLQQGGVEQTAVHNHLIGESPRVVYMHVMARGDAATIANALRAGLSQSKTPLAAPAPQSPAPLDLDTAAFSSALGVKGKGNGGVWQVAVPRPETIREGADEIPPSMGLATSINVQPTGNGRAVATGDFVLLPSEVNPVIRALKANGIAITALHSHLMMDQPHVLFMHFWGNDDAAKLARGLRAALDATAMAPR